MSHQLVASTLARIREAGGDALLQKVFKGDYDLPILQIQYARRNILRQQKGTEGQIGEKLAELNVPEEAFKLEEIFRTGMSLSQKYLTETGYRRDALLGYVGRRSYNADKILRTNYDEFVTDLLEAADVDASEVADLRNSFMESASVVYSPGTAIDDVTEAFNKRRKIQFKSGEAEHKFMTKYGQATGESNTAGRFSAFFGGSRSNIVNGFMSSVHADSGLAAVTSVFGTRPHMALDLAQAVLEKKRRDAFLGGQMTEAESADMSSKLARTKAMSKVILNDWLTHESNRWGVGKVSQFTKTLKSLANSVVLWGTGTYAYWGDTLTIGAQLEKLQRTTKRGRGFHNLLTSMRDRFWAFHSVMSNKEHRQKVSGLMNIALTADTKEYLSRFSDDAVGTASWLETATARAGLAPQITDRNKAGQMFLVGHVMQERMKHGWGDFPMETQNLLGQYGITPEIWEMVRKLPGIHSDIRGHKFLSLQDLSVSLTESLGFVQGRNVTKMYEAFFHDIITKSVVENQVYSKAFWSIPGMDKDGIYHNLHRLTEMYKGTGAEMAHQAKAAMYDLQGQGKRPYFYEAQGVAVLGAISLMSGVLSLWTLDVISGKTPRIPDDPSELRNFLWDATVRSGMFGLWGDFLLSDHADNKLRWLGYFTGPALGGLYQLGKLPLTVSEMALGDPQPIQTNIKGILKEYTPVFGPAQKLLLNSFLLDTLGDYGDWLNAKSTIGRRKNRMKEWNQEYFFE